MIAVLSGSGGFGWKERNGLRCNEKESERWDYESRVTYQPKLKKIEQKVIRDVAAARFDETRSRKPAIGKAVADLLRAGIRCLHLHTPAEERSEAVSPLRVPAAIQDKLRIPGLRRKPSPLNIRANCKTKPKRDQ